MNREQMMEDRCPGSKFIKKVYLENAEFVYDGKSVTWDDKAVANVVSSEKDIVYGGLFEITKEHLATLDTRYEGFPKSYGRGMVKVKDEDGNVYDAWMYFRVGQKRGEPSERYRETMRRGAEDCGLSEEYIKNNL